LEQTAGLFFAGITAIRALVCGSSQICCLLLLFSLDLAGRGGGGMELGGGGLVDHREEWRFSGWSWRRDVDQLLSVGAAVVEGGDLLLDGKPPPK